MSKCKFSCLRDLHFFFTLFNQSNRVSRFLSFRNKSKLNFVYFTFVVVIFMISLGLNNNKQTNITTNKIRPIFHFNKKKLNHLENNYYYFFVFCVCCERKIIIIIIHIYKKLTMVRQKQRNYFSLPLPCVFREKKKCECVRFFFLLFSCF